MRTQSLARKASILVLLAACSACASPPAPALAGPRWELAQLEGQPVQGKAFLQFDAAQGRVSGHSGCNRLSGAYAQEGGRLKLAAAASTRMACIGPGDELERRFLAMYQKVAGWRAEGAQMLLLDADGRELARFSAAAAEPRP